MDDSEPRAAAAGAGRAGALSCAGDDFLAVLELAPDDLGEASVGDADLHGDGPGLAVRAEDEDPPRAHRASAATGAAAGLLAHFLVVLGALLRSQGGSNLLAAGFPDLL